MKSKIKILYIIDTYRSPYAGTEGQLYKLISNLDKSIYEPHLLLFNHSDYIQNNVFPCDVTVLGSSSLSSLTTWLALFSAAKKKRDEGFRIAHIFFNDPSIIGPPVLKLLGFKVIISRRDMGYWYTSGYLAALRFNSMLLNGAIVNSEAVKSITHEKERISLNNIHVIYNGYESSEEIKPPFRNIETSASLQQGVINIGLVANIRPIKRIEDAIKAVGFLKKMGKEVNLTIVGDGDPSSLAKLADQQAVGNNVLFAGSQKEVKKFVSNFDIAILCSESEGFSNSIIEYMQCGKPVVCSNVGGNPEIVVNGFNGYLYEAGDVEGLVDRLISLIDSNELRQRLGQNGQSKVQEEYSISTMLDAHHKVYQTLCSF